MTPVLRKAIHLLAHPLSLAAAILILVNDFVLCPLVPSWWTGKLSDAGALVIWPLLIAAGLTWVLPRRWKLTGGLALTLTLAGYLLLKLSPMTNAWLVGLSGSRLRAVADPSDLLLLPVLLLPAWLWFRDEIQAMRPLRLRWEPLLAALVLLVGVADAAAPDYGAVCFTQESAQIIVNGGYYHNYSSVDGGRTWAYAEMTPGDQCQMRASGEVLDVAAPNGPTYRVIMQEKVERKTAAGGWEEILAMKDPSQAEQMYRNQTQSTNLHYLRGPLDAMLVPQSGDLLLAMSTDGILLIEPNGKQTWVAVGEYRHGGLRQDGIVGMVSLLSLEFLLAFLVGVAWWLNATLRHDRTRWQTAWVVIAWIGVALAVFMAHPDFVSGYFAAITMLGVLVLGVYLAVIVIARVIRVARKNARGLLLPLAGIPVIMLLFILPFVLWGLNILPEFMLAALVAGILVAAAGVPLAMALGKKTS